MATSGNLKKPSQVNVVYQPQILIGIRRICEVFKVGKDRVYSWIDDGAPISHISKRGQTYYSTEVMRLQMWLEAQ